MRFAPAGPTLRPQQLAELARLVPEIREQFPELEQLRQGQPSPLAESWQRLHFYESLSAVFGKEPQAAAAVSRRHAVVRSRLVRVAQRSVNLFRRGRRPRCWARYGPKKRAAIIRSPGFWPACGNRGWFWRFRCEPLDAQETAELARLESAKPLESANLGEIFRATRGNPLFVVESVRAGLQSTRVHAVIAARLAQLTRGFLRTGRPGERGGEALLLRIAREGHRLGRSQRFPGARRTLAAAHHRKPRSFGVRFHARPPARSGLRGTEPGAPALSAPARGAGAGRGVWRPTSIAGTGRLPRISNRPEWPEEAIEHYWRAAAYARQRYADTEAADLLRRALALCRGFPESDRRLKQELDLLATLGPALVTTEGYSAAGSGRDVRAGAGPLATARRPQYLRDPQRRLGLSHRARRSGKSAPVQPGISERGGTRADSRADAGGQLPPGKQPVSSGPTGSVAAST